MAHLDVQADLVRRLGAALSPVPVAAVVHEAHPVPAVYVWREGGRVLDPVRDRPGVGVWCYGESELEASDLAQAVDSAMRSLTFAEGYDDVEQESMRRDWDPDERKPRWYLSYTLTTHKPPTE